MYYQKSYLIPKSNVYLNIQCGRSNCEHKTLLPMIGDDSGISISERNKHWSEITGLYWYWKNSVISDYVGLCSYRRFFNFKATQYKGLKIIPSSAVNEIDSINTDIINEILIEFDIIVPKRYVYRESIYSVCKRNYLISDFYQLESIIAQISPEYLTIYKYIFYDNNKLLGHNMFVMRKELFLDYCDWVFPILLKLEETTNPKNYPINQIRLYGYMHELLLDVYVRKNRLREYKSQIIWVTDDLKKSRFNSGFLQMGYELYFRISKSLRFC